jgi:hypothetical protein
MTMTLCLYVLFVLSSTLSAQQESGHSTVAERNQDAIRKAEELFEQVGALESYDIRHANALQSKIDLLTKAIDLNPTRRYYESRAEANYRRDKIDDAIRDYSSALELAQELDSKVSILLGRSNCYRVKVRDHWPDLAVKDAELAKKYADELRNKGGSYSADPLRAFEDIENLSICYLKRGYYAYRDKKYACAAGDYARALHLARELKSSSSLLDYYLQNSDKILEDCVKRVRQSGVVPEVMSVTLEKELHSRTAKISPPIVLPANTEKLVEDTVIITHSITISEEWETSAEVKGKVSAWFSEVSLGVRHEVSKETAQTFSKQTERKRGITIKGSGNPIHVLWVDYYRSGVATIKIDQETVKMPFEFKVDFDLLAKEASK